MASSLFKGPRVLNMYPGTEALPVYCEQVYRKLAADTRFPHEISSSMFSYYMATLTMYRLLKLSKFNGGDTSLFEEQLLQSAPLYKLPEFFANYLAGFGDINYGGLHLKFHLLPRTYKENNGYGLRADCHLDGWWDRIDENTHFLYAMYPSLPVFYSRIVADLNLTLNGSTDSGLWNLVHYIRPREAGAGYPTANLLGYQPARRLRCDQVRFLSSCGLGQNLFTQHYCSHRTVNHRLISGIYRRLNGYMNLVEVPTTTTGYVSQIPYQTSHVGTMVPEWSYLCSSIVNVQPFALSAASAYQAGAFLYRIKRVVQTTEPNNWCVYDFQKYSMVPSSWQQSSNRARELEDDILIKSRYQSFPYYFQHRVQMCVDKELMQNNFYRL